MANKKQWVVPGTAFNPAVCQQAAGVPPRKAEFGQSLGNDQTDKDPEYAQGISIVRKPAQKPGPRADAR